MREPGAREICLPDFHDLCLRRQPAQRRTVQHPSPVPLERRAVRARGCFGWLGDEPGGVVLPVAHRLPAVAYLLSLPPASSSATTRPASRRATGTLNGEQDT